MSSDIACLVCGACSYSIEGRARDSDGIETQTFKCKCCTFVWSTTVFQGRILRPVVLELPEVKHIRTEWVKVLMTPMTAKGREAIEALGKALARSGLVPDEKSL